MVSALPVPKKAFLRTHVIPVLLIFLIPGFSAWFFTSAETWLDNLVRGQLEVSLLSDTKLPEATKERAREFYRSVPVSRIMASNKPEAAELQANFSSVSLRYFQFRWLKRIAWICLLTIAATFVIVGISVAFSFRSQSAQYYALRIGWPVLRTSAAIQVLGQAVLAIALSFWVTAIWADSYFPKLILIAGVAAVVGVIALWQAIFAKVDDRCEVEGEMIPESAAPGLWQRVREMAARLETAAPDRIIAGIVPSFFVTEHPVTLGREVYHGRTLYLSLPMLKVLAVEEADAVLGHELAHFSGSDTLWSRRIAPLQAKFALYLRTLANGLTVIVAHFMHLFWKLYGLSISRLSRVREFRADGLGAELVSPEAMKRALVKITCYCDYRSRTEQGILEKERVDSSLDLARRLEHGYPAFLASFVRSDQAIHDRIPHPFDSHPTLHSRLEKLGFEAREALQDAELEVPAERSWYQAIATAPALEERLWNRQQAALQEIHSQQLAWRLLPSGPEETAHVVKYFPLLRFQNKKSREASLAFDRVQLPDLATPILFQDIVSATLKDTWGKKRLTIVHRVEGVKKPKALKCYPALFTGEQGTLLANFVKYYSRYKTALAQPRAAAA